MSDDRETRPGDRRGAPVLEVRASRRKSIGMLAIGLGGLLFGLLALLLPSSDPESVQRFSGWLMLAAGAFFLLFALVGFRMPNPVIVVDQEGVRDRRVAMNPITWDNILEVRLFVMPGSRGMDRRIVFVLRDRQKCVDGIPWRRRFLRGPAFAKGVWQGDYHMTAFMLDKSPEQIVACIRRELERRRQADAPGEAAEA